MQSNCKNRTLTWITNQLKKGNISLSHKLQRKEGQWNKKTKSELIDSLLRDYPINPVYSIKENDVISIIDGVQRISTVRDFMSDSFALHKGLEPVKLRKNTEDGVVETEYIIAGKKFSKLDEEVREILMACELQIYELTDCTEKDVREMFRRQNSGKVLNNTQLRTVVETDEMSKLIYSLSSHPFFDKVLSYAQKRKDLEKDLIIETLMLIETDATHDYTSFRSEHINEFITMYQENIKYDRIDVLKQALDKLNENFEELKIKQLNIPMIMYSAYRVIKDKKSFGKLVEAINTFVETYDTNEDYKQYCTNGTTFSENVKGRFEYWRNVVRTL